MSKSDSKYAKLVSNLHSFDEYVKSIEQGGKEIISDDLRIFVENRGGKTRLDLAMAQLKNGNMDACLRSLNKVKKAIALVSADDPLEIGAKVCLERSEHGWHNGSLTGKVVGFDGRGYTVLLSPEDGGYEVYVNHRRDMYRGW